MPEAIATFREDHDTMRGLLDELEMTTDEAVTKREKLLITIEHELKIHTRIEEDAFYPAFLDAAEKSDDKEGQYEVVRSGFRGTDPRSEQFAAQAKVLKNFVQQHAKEEEGEMFPRARKLIDSGELMRPGEALTGAKESAAAGVLDRPMGFVRS